MRIRVVVFIAILVAIATGEDLDRVFAPIQFGYRVWPGATAVRTSASGKQFEVALPKVAAGPKWEQGKKHPPLSASEAIAKAIDKSTGFVKDHRDLIWGIKDATLMPWKPREGYWYWSIRLELRPNIGNGGGGYSGPLPTVCPRGINGRHSHRTEGAPTSATRTVAELAVLEVGTKFQSVTLGRLRTILK